MLEKSARCALCASLTVVLAFSDTPAELDALSGPELHRKELIQTVLERNPGIEAAHHAWQAALERYPQATTLGDPMLSYRLAPQSIGDSDARLGQVLTVSQRFPYPGRLELQGEIAQAEADAAYERLQTASLDLGTLASLLFDDYYLVHRAIEVNEEHIQLVEEFKRIATVRYAAGKASQQDPIQAEVELAHLSHRKLVLESDRAVLVARINTLLHRHPEIPIPPPPRVLPVPSIPLQDAGQLQEEALTASPELRGAVARIRGRRAAADLEATEARPTFEAMTSYNSMWNTPEHRWTIGMAVNIPIKRKRIQAAVAEAKAETARMESERSRLEDDVRAKVQQALIRVREAHHVVELYRSRLRPAARDQVKAALSGFRAGQDSFLVLIEAEKNQRSVELRYHESLTDVYRRTAELHRAVSRVPDQAELIVGTATSTRPASAEWPGESR